jgi:hypothetical protein
MLCLRRLTHLTLCLTVLAVAPALAQTGETKNTQVTKPIYPWKTETSFKTGDAAGKDAKVFSHCLTKNMYDNGILLLLAENTKAQRRLALHFPQDKLEASSSYDLQWQVDRQASRPVTAVAATPRILAIAIDDAMTQQIVRGNMLFLRGPNDTLVFDMVGVGDAIQSLHNCLITNGVQTGSVNITGSARPASDAYSPSAVHTTAPSPEPVTSSAANNLSPAVIDIFTRAGMKPQNVMVVPMAQRQDKPFDAVWMHDALFIGVRSEAPVPHQALPQIAAHFTDKMQQLCGGEFLAEGGQIEQRGKSYIMPAEVACSPSDTTKGKSTVAALLLALDSTALKIFFIEAPEQQGSQAVQLRDKLQSLIQ